MTATSRLLFSVFVATLTGNIGAPVALANTPPTLSPLVNQTINEDAGSLAVPLTGIGSGTPEENQQLTITAVSSNPSVLPNPIITYTSPSDSGSLVVKPVTNAFGTATITVTVNDGQPSDNTVVRAFMVTIVAVNDLPVLSAIANRAINENTSTGPISFRVVDAETPAASLIVTAQSSNPTLVQASNLVFAGTGTNRTLSVAPTPNQFGTATITVTAADSAGGTTSRSFIVTVNAALRIAPAGIGALVSWTAANGVLQQCVGIEGQWEDVLPEPTSPLPISTSGIRFYRLRQR